MQMFRGLNIALEYLEKRKNYFKELIQFDNNFLVWWKGLGKWTPINELDLDLVVNQTNLHRSMLINEIVFDVDVKGEIEENWDSIRTELIVVLTKLQKIFKPILLFSSGRLFHIHVFISPVIIEKFKNNKKTEIFNVLNHSYKKVLEDFFEREAERSIFILTHLFISLHIIRKLKLDKLKYITFDTSFINSKGKHLIRAEGSINEKTNCYKSYIIDASSLIKYEKTLVKNPIEINYPNLKNSLFENYSAYETLFEYAFWKYVEPWLYVNAQKYVKKPIEITTPYKKLKKYEWIEEILNRAVSDGRKRIVNLILAPYFAQIGLEEDKAVEIIMNWLDKCNELRKVDIRENYVLYQLRYAKSRNLRPLSKVKAKKLLNDVEELRDLI